MNRVIAFFRYVFYQEENVIAKESPYNADGFFAGLQQYQLWYREDNTKAVKSEPVHVIQNQHHFGCVQSAILKERKQ